MQQHRPSEGQRPLAWLDETIAIKVVAAY
jgi:hypothetical protein